MYGAMVTTVWCFPGQEKPGRCWCFRDHESAR
nr:MAG TPA: SUN domain-containing protein 1 complex SUN proteins.2A [Caudoviricetes sp.]